MPAEQINFRYNVPKSTSVQLLYRLKRDKGWLTEGLMHFPPGCNALVHVRMLLGLKGTLFQVTPIENQYIALDDANYAFLIDREIVKEDEILIEMINYDSEYDHQLSIILSWSDVRSVPVPMIAAPTPRVPIREVG